jgi:hypothetical protein
VDQRVEPPSWLPDGAAGSDAKGLASDDSVSDGPDGDGLDSDDPVTIGSVSRDPASYDAGGYKAASHDPTSDDPADHDPVSYDPVSYGTASHDPVSYEPASYGSVGGGLGPQGSAIPSSAGDSPGHDVTADVNANAYNYTGETSHPNGQDAPFGQESASVGAYGQGSAPVGAYGQESAPVGAYGHESGLAGGVSSAPPYPAQLTEPVTSARKTGDARRRPAFSAMPRKTKAGATPARRADLVLARLEPWSVMKFSFLISLVAWVMLFVAVALLWFALDTLGVFASVQRTLESVTSSSGSAGVSLTKWFSASRVLGYTMLIGAVNIILITALSTVGAMIYNLVTHLGGGIEVTLRESD